MMDASDSAQQGGRKTNPVRGYAGDLDTNATPAHVHHRSDKNTRDWCRGKVGVPHAMEWLSTLEISGANRFKPESLTDKQQASYLATELNWRWEQERCVLCGRLGRIQKVSHPQRADRYLRASGWVRMPRPLERYWKDHKGRMFLKEYAVRIQHNIQPTVERRTP